MSFLAENEITVNGIDFDTEHFVDGHIERIILWGKQDKLVGDAIVDHNAEAITVHFHTGEEKRTESYDYYEFIGTEDNEVAGDILARWMAAVA